MQDKIERERERVESNTIICSRGTDVFQSRFSTLNTSQGPAPTDNDCRERTCLALVDAISNFCPQLKDLSRRESTVVPTIGLFFRGGLPFRRHGQA